MDDGGNVERMNKEKRSGSVGREDKRMAEGSDGRRKRERSLLSVSTVGGRNTRLGEKNVRF